MDHSTSQYHHNRSGSRSASSTRSLIDANGRPISPIQPLRPTVYQPPQSHSRGRQPREQSDLYGAGIPLPHPSRIPSNLDPGSGMSSRSNSHSKPSSNTRTSRPRRKISRTALLKSHIRTKLRLTISFGITLLIGSIIYLSLAVTHVSSSTLFHVLSILLLLSLTAIFSHSLIRWLMLKRDYRAHSERKLQRTQPPSFRGWDISWPKPLDHQPPPEPIPVYMHNDHESLSQLSEPHPHEPALPDPVMAHPPPIYGNFRDSVRINPSHISVHALPTQPTSQTPTYHASISAPLNPNPILAAQMHGGLHSSYRPPSYGSEGGITQVLANRRREVEGALKKGAAIDVKGRGKVRVGKRVDGKVVQGMWVREKKSKGSRR